MRTSIGRAMSERNPSKDDPEENGRSRSEEVYRRGLQSLHCDESYQFTSTIFQFFQPGHKDKDIESKRKIQMKR